MGDDARREKAATLDEAPEYYVMLKRQRIASQSAMLFNIITCSGAGVFYGAR